MAKTDSRVDLATRRAELFLAKEKHMSLPVDIDQIAADLNIAVKAKPDTTAGVSGMLLRAGNNFGILYATHLANEGFERFSVAHELGHYLLDGHIDHVLPDDGVHESRAGFVSSDPYEREADGFAVGLLMPGALFLKAMAPLDEGFSAIEKLASLCRTSLTTTAIRYAQKATTSVAVVMSTNNTIDYCFMSEQLEAIDGLQWLKKREPVPADVETHRFNSDARNVERGQRTTVDVDLSDWFGGSRRLPGTEEVIGLGSYGKTLTVLTTDVLPDEEDEDEELEDRWAVRFRR